MPTPDVSADVPTDPFELAALYWPDVRLYPKQQEIIRSVWENDETVVPAGHMLGKDFVTGFLCLAFFLTRTPCRIVTTSVDFKQLEGVLWGEIRRFIQTSKFPLDHERGGPLVINHLHIRKAHPDGQIDGLSYLIGRVAALGEGMSGHHIARTGDGIPRTLFVSDEASGVDERSADKATEWANRMLLIGNPYECQNQFKWAVKGRLGTSDKGGDIPRASGVGFRRKVLKIRAEDSPNVQHAMDQQRAGVVPTGEIVIPGLLPWEDYCKRRGIGQPAIWDKVKQCVGLDAEFYEGAEVLMFPPDWLNRAEQIAEALKGKPRKAKAIGIDPAEGGDKTAMVAVDEFGLIELVSKQTPDTSVITGEALAFMRKHAVPPDRVVFDRGGGGKEHADRLRAQGYPVRTVAFGESLSLDPKRGMTRVEERLDNKEDRYAYKNRRAEMYGELRQLLDPAREGHGFGLPAEYSELRRQFSPIPLTYDPEGRLELPPKNKRGPDDTKVTLMDLIGCSPDEADALVLALHGMLHKVKRPVAGAR